MLLRVQSNNEGWDIDDLLSNSDMSLVDQDSSVVDGLGKTGLEDLSLESSLEEIFQLESQYVIESASGDE